MQSTSDEVLIGRVAYCERLAMQVLYARHHVRVFRFVVRLVRDEARAEDVISEVFLDVWRQAGRFEGRSAVSTWMLAIARFKALSALRRRPDQELGEETAGAIEDPSDDPGAALEKKDKSAMIRKCRTGLAAEHREVIDLVYYPRNRSKRWPRSLAFRRTRSRRACFTHASGWRSCSSRRELKEVGHERDKRGAGASGDRSSAAVSRGRDAEPTRRRSRGASAGRRPRTGAAI